MSGAILPLPQYSLMAWWSVKKSTGTTLPFTFTFYSHSYPTYFRDVSSKRYTFLETY